MKIKRWTLKSMMTASISADFEFSTTDDGRIQDHLDLSSRGACNLLSIYPETQEFLSKMQPEDLVKYFDDNDGSIYRIEFGDWAMMGGDLYHLCRVYTKAELQELPPSLFQFVEGQLSDGWGEGMEQRTAYRGCVEFSTPSFDGYSGFEAEERQEDFEVYFHYWNADNFELSVRDCTEEEVDWVPEKELKVAFSCASAQDDGSFRVVTVYEFVDIEMVLNALKESYILRNEEMISFIEQTAPFGCAVKYYLTIINEGLHSYPRPTLGIVDMDLHKAKLFIVNEDVEVMEFPYEEGQYTQFYKEIFTR